MWKIRAITIGCIGGGAWGVCRGWGKKYTNVEQTTSYEAQEEEEDEAPQVFKWQASWGGQASSSGQDVGESTDAAADNTKYDFEMYERDDSSEEYYDEGDWIQSSAAHQHVNREGRVTVVHKSGYQKFVEQSDQQEWAQTFGRSSFRKGN